MKKIICLLLTLVLMISAVGCNQNVTIQTDANSTSDSGKQDAPVAQKPLVAVSVPVTTETLKADNGTVLFNYIHQNISLVFSDPDIADKVILDFLNRVDQSRTDAERLSAAANNAYTGSGSWTPYLCQFTYDPIRIDQSVLSMFGTYATYSGQIRPEASYSSVTYDLTTGNVLSLSNILTEGASFDALANLVIASLTEQKEEKFLDDNFADTVKDRFSDSTGQYDTWYFSTDGLCFYFSPYEIAPSASGVIIAEIPYAKLTGIMKDAYFPAERDSAKGSLFCQPFSNANLDKFTKFAEIIADKDGEQSIIYTDKAVYDLRIERGSWSADGANFRPQYTLFAAASLTPGDAIHVQATLPDGKSDLRLTYTTDDGPVSVFLQKGSQLS